MRNYTVFENVAVSESGFLFLPVTGETFTMNEIAREVFNQLKAKQSYESIISTIEKEYDIDRKSLEIDLDDFFSQLLKFNLIREL